MVQVDDARRAAMITTRAAVVRRGLASAASLLLSALLLAQVVSADGANKAGEWAFVLVAIATPAVAGVLLWTRWLAAQLLARGTWWSSLLVGGLALTVGGRDGRDLGVAMAACGGVALLAAGRLGLDVSDRRFQPVAFRRTLLLALVLAMADTGALLWLGLGNAMFEGDPSLLLLVPFMIAGVIGLLRLRTWGLIVSMASNVALVTLALCNVIYLPHPVRSLFIATALLQLLVPLPMLVSIVRARRHARP
jgi:hypothetical protein